MVKKLADANRRVPAGRHSRVQGENGLETMPNILE